MHEWSIAQAIVETINEVANEKNARRVKLIKLKVGSLAMLDTEIIKDALRILSENTKLEGAKLEIENEDTKFKCKKCGYTWSFSEIENKIKDEWKDTSVTDEEGTQDLSIHYFPELIYIMARCPKCNSKDFEILGSKEILVEGLELEI